MEEDVHVDDCGVNGISDDEGEAEEEGPRFNSHIEMLLWMYFSRLPKDNLEDLLKILHHPDFSIDDVSPALA